MATTRSSNHSSIETADLTLLTGSSSDESNSGRRIPSAPSLQQAAQFLRQASERRMMREPSMMVRVTLAEQLEEWQSNWAYSKLMVINYILRNFVFIVVAVAALILIRDESPSLPLRLWISGYALKCVVHVVCVCFEFRRRRRMREQLITNGGNAVGGGGNRSEDLDFDSIEGSGVNLGQNGDDGFTR
ncbi:E3 ubiquitin-protein ligase at1g12760-like protein [Trifolium pratense]|uniref:RING-type E3 ubiquitin transferase n=1 Tax=Trifolium pratense TaxID=57577 RepID=A0A2K3NNX2_TRIPR|nr:E3 ubiquitin-protein ligase at1g12760-like protein [Trifolium pratense]